MLMPRQGATALYQSLSTKYVGSVGTIVSEGRMENYLHHGDLLSYQVRWDQWGLVGFEPDNCLAPLDDDAAYRRFLEKVLKPLPEPIAA